jgi:hypothetical protein
MIDASTADTVPALLSMQAQIRGNASALFAVSRDDVSYKTLSRDVARFGALLARLASDGRAASRSRCPEGRKRRWRCSRR